MSMIFITHMRNCVLGTYVTPMVNCNRDSSGELSRVVRGDLLIISHKHRIALQLKLQLLQLSHVIMSYSSYI